MNAKYLSNRFGNQEGINLSTCLNRAGPEFNPNLLLTPTEVAVCLSTTEGTLSVWRCTGRYELNFVKCGRFVRYRAEDVLLFLERRTFSRTGEVSNG
jgi:hypothetical protein